MQGAPKGNNNPIAEKQGSPRVVNGGSAGTVAFDSDTTFDHPSRQSSGRRPGPLLGGLFTTTIVILTLVTAVILGSQEGMLVAGVGSEKSTATPSPIWPSASAVPSAIPSPLSTPLPSPSPTQAIYPGYTPAASCPIPSNWLVYVVRSGETLAQIAARYRITASDLQAVNCLQSAALYQGQPIYVPPISVSAPTAKKTPSCVVRTDWFRYIVKRGDTLSGIARSVGTSVDTLRHGNCLLSDTIYAGQTLWVPNPPKPTPAPTATRRPTATSSGEPPTATSTGEPPTATSTGERPSDTPLPPSDTPLPPSDTPRPTKPLRPSDTPTPPPEPTVMVPTPQAGMILVL